jgi:hypothetical protein
VLVESTPVEPTQVAGPISDLMTRQVMLRYDGRSGMGIFEATLCNLGEVAASPPFEVQFLANGIAPSIKVTAELPPHFCAGVHVPDSSFAAYNITQPGVVDVQVNLITVSTDPQDNNTYQESVRIDKLDVAPPAGQLADYQQCRNNEGHADCSARLKLDPVADPHEIKKQSGDYIAIVPAEYEFLATWFVVDNQLCAPSLESYLGIPHPAPTVQRAVISDYEGGYTVYGSAIFSSAPQSGFDYYQQTEGLEELFWRNRLDDECSNIHEMTHWFLGYTPMPGWLEEGLATIVEDNTRTNYSESSSIECREDGWYGTDMNGNWGTYPFQNLTVYDASVPGIYYYYSASCFWVYIEEQYGVDKVKQIIQQVVQHRLPLTENFCDGSQQTFFFIRDIVNPVIGEDISSVTRSRWGFDQFFSDCQ